MKITIHKGSYTFGLTYENLQIPSVKNYLSSKGMSVSFPEKDVALVESANGFTFNQAFQAKIAELERSYYASPKEPELSWFVLNEFVCALGGSAALTMFLAVLCGASVMGIVVTGCVTGLAVGTAYMMCGFFRDCCQDDELSWQSDSELLRRDLI